MKNNILLLIICTLILSLTTIGRVFANDENAKPTDNMVPTVIYGPCCIGPFLCPSSMCETATSTIVAYHAQAETIMLDHITAEFEKHRDWMIEKFFKQHILRALMMMTEQFSAVAFQQMQIIGSFFDAKEQLEAQRLFQTLEYEAHKDYQPSEAFCAFGTNVRSLHSSESKAKYGREALNERNMSRFLGEQNSAGAGSAKEDLESRWKKFTTTYCDPSDNNLNVFKNKDKSGLKLACPSSPADKQRINADIDFTRVIEAPRTLDADFTKQYPGSEGEDVLALLNNLYGHKPLTRQTAYISKESEQKHYMALRAITAQRNVAQNSMNAIVSMKTAGSDKATNTRQYMGKLLENLGVPDNEIPLMIGDEPSYYAQMETLAKRIGQSPEFYLNLYDKPANVARKGAALKAIELMIGRDMYESQIRREMLLSVLLSNRLRKEEQIAEGNLK